MTLPLLDCLIVRCVRVGRTLLFDYYENVAIPYSGPNVWREKYHIIIVTQAGAYLGGCWVMPHLASFFV